MFKIDNIKKIYDKYKDCFNVSKKIHITGTNGKGSTSKIIYNILSEGYKVGLYTSPYYQKRFDNIMINEKVISIEDVNNIISKYEKDFIYYNLSDFEIDTFIALIWFENNNCDFSIIEVGLGGSNDATNIITPILSVITNIGLDHKDILGNTKKEIALVKAGIIKKNIDVIISNSIKNNALSVISDKALEMNSNLIISKRSTYYKYITKIKSYQKYNYNLALNVIEYLKEKYEITDAMIVNGLNKNLLDKRFEVISNNPFIIIDGAHNNEGIKVLINSINTLKNNRDIVIIMGVLKDKPYKNMIKLLNNISNEIYLFKFNHERALDPYKMFNITIKDNIEEIRNIIKKDNKIYLFTGSLYFLREIDYILKEYKKNEK